MLQHAGVVAHQADVLEVDLGELRGPRGECLRLEDRTEPVRVLATCPFEALNVAMRDRRPHHLSTMGSGPFAESETLGVVAE